MSQDFENSVIRGPYLQQATTNEITIRWRTNEAVPSFVQYGLNAEQLNLEASSFALTTEHEITLNNLLPNTKYFYTICQNPTNCLNQDESYHFYTNPTIGTEGPYQFWILGDAGTKNEGQLLVRNGFEDFIGEERINATIWLGDNAYNNGTEVDYQVGFFNVYPHHLRQTCPWLTIGNHELWNGETSSNPTYGPYYDMFTIPTAGEAGGRASGTEAFYSFDYGNVHFICLNSEDYGRDSTNAMGLWLKQDLALNASKWTVAFFHSPPYTKGSHDSDYENESFEMRQEFNPILERFDVDVVLTGHSHCYERSKLIKGHFGNSNSFTPNAHVLDGRSGHLDENQAYQKNLTGGQGTVYVTMGCSGRAKVGKPDFPHPVSYYAIAQQLGSGLLAINEDTLTFKFVDENGEILDYFNIVKTSNVAVSTAPSLQISPDWQYYFVPTQVSIFAQYLQEEDLSIYYTIDGSTPTLNSTVYDEPFNLVSSGTVQAMACNAAGICNIETQDFVLIDSISFAFSDWWRYTWLQISPNPIVDGMLYVRHNLPANAETVFSVYDVSGHLIKTMNATDVASLTYGADLQDLPKGLYLLKIWVNERPMVVKKIFLR